MGKVDDMREFHDPQFRSAFVFFHTHPVWGGRKNRNPQKEEKVNIDKCIVQFVVYVKLRVYVHNCVVVQVISDRAP